MNELNFLWLPKVDDYYCYDYLLEYLTKYLQTIINPFQYT